MGVIPCRAVVRRPEPVRVAFSRCDGTLGHRRHPILPRRVSLREAVPVKSRALWRMIDVVADLDLNPVTPVGLTKGLVARCQRQFFGLFDGALLDLSSNTCLD